MYTNRSRVQAKLKAAYIDYDRLYENEGHWIIEWDCHRLNTCIVPRMQKHGFMHVRAFNVKTEINGRQRWQMVIHFSLPAEPSAITLQPTITPPAPPLSPEYAENHQRLIEQNEATIWAWMEREFGEGEDIYVFMRCWETFMSARDAGKVGSDDHNTVLEQGRINGDITDHGRDMVHRLLQFVGSLEWGI